MINSRFSVSESESSTSSEEEEKDRVKVSQRFRAESIPPISRIIRGIRTSCPAGLESEVAERAQENGTATGENSTATNNDDSELMETAIEKPSEDVSLSFLDGNKSAHLDALRKTLTTYPTLETLPNKNDYIGFRILKLSDEYVPELSEYIIGLVENVKEESMELEIVILAGNEELRQHQQGGKFSLPDCNDTLIDVDDNTLHINWVELKDVRLVTF